MSVLSKKRHRYEDDTISKSDNDKTLENSKKLVGESALESAKAIKYEAY